jgi:hypothetical protein
VFEIWWKVTEEMINIKKLLTIFLLLFSINGYCQWKQVSESDSSTVYIELSSVKRMGKSVRVWSLYNFINPLEFGKSGTYRSLKSYDEYDCVEDRSKNLAMLFYSGDMGEGVNIHTSDKVGDWRFHSPGSIGLSLLKSSCRLK